MSTFLQNTSISHNPDSFNGILLVDKPSGPTSHDIVDEIRRHFRFKKVGHAGTLDPQATGLLTIMIGRGTKLANVLMTSDKIYEGTLRLGITTNTQDAAGTILHEADFSHVTRDAFEMEMKKWRGDIFQTPPMVSAVKKNGVPLYKLARKGITVERKPKLIHIYEFKLLDFTLPRASFYFHCSKGVYVRTLCADIGEALGCGAHLESLRRTRGGDFSVQNATTIDEILRLDLQQLYNIFIPLHRINLTSGCLL